MQRRWWRRARQLGVASGATALLLSGCGGGGASSDDGRLEPPNVLVILIDCLRADHVGAYGYHRPTTPSLDRLAAESTIFTRAYAQAHWTRPSVPSLLTGLYPSEHGLFDVERNSKGQLVGSALAPAVVTLAESLQGAGYETLLIAEQSQLARAFKLDQGFDHYQLRAGRSPHIRRRFRRWLDQRPAKNFFAYLHFLDIHWPYCPPKRFRDRFDAGSSQLDTCGGWRQLRADIRSGERVLSAAEVERLMARYDEELVALDASLGSLFGDLRQRGLWEETLIIVTADHGEEFMEHGHVGHNQGLTDTLLWVPLIVKPPASWPGSATPRVEAVVELRSVAPTVRQAAGLDAGAGGPSLLPYLLGEQAPRSAAVAIAESSTELWVRSATHALVVSKEGSSVRLFDRRAEALERTDVAAEQAATVAELRAHLTAWRTALIPVQPQEIHRGDELGDETVEGLKALGYID